MFDVAPEPPGVSAWFRSPSACSSGTGSTRGCTSCSIGTRKSSPPRQA